MSRLRLPGSSLAEAKCQPALPLAPKDNAILHGVALGKVVVGTGAFFVVKAHEEKETRKRDPSGIDKKKRAIASRGSRSW